MALGAGPAAVLASVLLAAPVLVWAALTPSWPVRAVVAWAMLVTGSVGLVAIATSRALESSLPWASLPVAAGGSAVVVFALGRLNGPFRRVLGIRAGIRRAVRAPLFLHPALLRPALALGVFFAAMAVGGLTGVAPRPGEGSRPETSPGTVPGPSTGPGAVDASDVRPVSADTAPPFGSARGVGSSLLHDLARSALAGSSSAGTGATARLDSSTAVTGRTDSGAPTPGSGSSTAGSSTADSPTADSPTGSPDDTPDQPSATVSSEPAGDPDPTEVPQNAPVTKVNDTVRDVTEPVNEVTDPVQDDGQEAVAPVQRVVEETTEPVRAVVEETTEPVQNVVEETAEPVQQVVEETTESVTGATSSLLP